VELLFKCADVRAYKGAVGSSKGVKDGNNSLVGFSLGGIKVFHYLHDRSERESAWGGEDGSKKRWQGLRIGRACPGALAGAVGQ